MARATNGPAAKKRHKKVLKYAKGYFGNKSKLFRYAKDAVQHAWQYAYIDRKKKKADRRGLWIVRLNAACRANGITYSRFIEGARSPDAMRLALATREDFSGLRDAQRLAESVDTFTGWVSQARARFRERTAEPQAASESA